MSVCSATAAASSRPGCRRESRSSNTRASTSDAQFFVDRRGSRMADQRKYSTVSTTKSASNSTLCCCISVLMALALICHIGTNLDFIG